MIEEQDDGTQNLMQSDLHSIAVFCQLTGCPLPKVVSTYLLRESTTAKLASVIFCSAIVISLFVCFVFGGLLGLMYVGTVDDKFLLLLAWFTRGMARELFFQIFIVLVLFAAALIGLSFNFIVAMIAAVTFSGVCATLVWYLVAPTDDYGIRSYGVFIVGSICVLITVVGLHTGLAR